MLPDRPPINVASCCDLPVGIVRWGETDRRVTAIVKATVSLHHERAWLAFQQAELSVDRASPFSPDELLLASDFAPFKPRIDVLLVGSAYSQGPEWIIAASMVAGALRRELFAHSGEPRNAIPLSSCYLRDAPHRGAVPVAVGPLAPHARVGEGWARFNAAPPEQQLDAFAEDAALDLDGLLRGAPRRTVSLPAMRPRVHLVDLASGRILDAVRLRCDTVVIDTDRAVCSLTWRGTFDASAADRPCLLVAYERFDARPTETDLRRDLAQAKWSSPVEAPEAPPLRAEPPSRQEALPSEEPPPRRDSVPAVAPLGSTAPSIEELEPPTFAHSIVDETLVHDLEKLVRVLPFVPAPPEPAFARSIVDETTVHDVGQLVPVLPFVRAPEPIPTPPRTRAMPSPALPFSYVAPVEPPPPATPAPEPMAARSSEHRGLDAYAAVQIDLWAGRASLSELLAARGLDEHAYRTTANELLHDLSAEAGAGRSARILRLAAEMRRWTLSGGAPR